MKYAAAVLTVVTLVGCGRTGDRVVVAAGTTLVDSRLLDELVAGYEAAHPQIRLSVVGEATAHVLELGRRGGADLLITHDPAAEEGFVGEGRAARYDLVFESRFIVVGPPALVARLPNRVDESMTMIADRGWPFVSRSDGSGTYAKELELWSDVGFDPAGRPWYVETGQGMGPTLQVADQRRAFTLSELGAYLTARETLGLAVADLEADPLLVNPYHLIVVAGTPEQAAAEGFAVWLLSEEGRAAIVGVNRELFGEVVYAPIG